MKRKKAKRKKAWEMHLKQIPNLDNLASRQIPWPQSRHFSQT